MRGEPGDQLLEPVFCVGKDFVFELLIFFNQTHIELQLGNVNAKHALR